MADFDTTINVNRNRKKYNKVLSYLKKQEKVYLEKSNYDSLHRVL